MVNTFIRRTRRSALALIPVIGLVACEDSIGPTSPSYVDGARLVVTQVEAGRPVLYTGTVDGTSRTRIHLTDVVDRIPGNTTALVVQDENLLALAAPRISPSGAKIAVVATLAYDQSEIVVLNRDGSAAEVASVNTQIIASDPDWSPDGTKLAYSMSTLPGFLGLDLFITDLATHTVTRLTTGARVTSAVRWSQDGKSIYFAHTTGTTTNDNWLSEIVRVDVATKAAQVVASGIVGEVNAISRSGLRALVTRNAPVAAASTSARTLVEVGFDHSVERTIISTDAGYGRYPALAEDVVIATLESASARQFGIYIGATRIATISGLGLNASVDAMLLSPALINLSGIRRS